MEIPNNVRKLIYGMFDTMIEGVDKYDTKSSTWLIFTEQKRWVIEFTNEKTLWFNYNLFQSELNLLSMDCVESKDIIKEWFESRFLGIDVVEETLSTAGKPLKVEDTIQNGVKRTQATGTVFCPEVEDTIQNGVKDTQCDERSYPKWVEDTIQNGVKETIGTLRRTKLGVDDIIKNGVKEINHVDVMKFFDNKMEEALQNCIKETKSMCGKRDGRVNNTIENGVKDTHFNFQSGLIQVEDVIQNGVRQTNKRLQKPFRSIKDAIQNGVKHTEPGIFNHPMFVEETIQNGVRHTEVDGMRIRSGVKDAIQEGVKETRFQKSSNLYRIEDTRTLWGKSGDEGVVEYIIQEGVKDIIEDSYPHKHRVDRKL